MVNYYLFINLVNMSSQIELTFLDTIPCDRIPCEIEFAQQHVVYTLLPGGTNKGGVSSI